jgi:hypothetical protein
MMSNRAEMFGKSASVIALAPKPAASSSPRDNVRLATVMLFGFRRGKVRRGELDHVAGADQEQVRFGQRREDSRASCTLAAAIEIDAGADVGVRPALPWRRKRTSGKAC